MSEIKELTSDSSVISTNGDDWVGGSETISEVATQVLHSNSGFRMFTTPNNYKVTFEIEEFINVVRAQLGKPHDGSLFINDLRQNAGVWDANTWDEWWEKADLKWKVWCLKKDEFNKP